MSIQIHSENQTAFKHLTDALQQIEEYFSQGREITSVENALNLINDALAIDPNYGLALFYKGMALDLVGKPADAIEYFQKIQDGCRSKQLQIESTFNLGVAFYHRYSHSNLKKAKEKFDNVISSNNASSELKDLAKALLAQTHAMLMRPSYAERQDMNGEVLMRIRNDFKRCNELSQEYDVSSVKENYRVKAVFSNAKGMANMYLTDYVETSVEKKQEHLEIAINNLEKASQFGLENDWANSCDLGSAQLRLGVLQREKGADGGPNFEFAEKFLVRVVEKLRPNYGFALYELGILNRVWGRFEKAKEYQEAALKIPVQYRDIADDSVKKELDRISNSDSEYP